MEPGEVDLLEHHVRVYGRTKGEEGFLVHGQHDASRVSEIVFDEGVAKDPDAGAALMQVDEFHADDL